MGGHSITSSSQFGLLVIIVSITVVVMSLFSLLSIVADAQPHNSNSGLPSAEASEAAPRLHASNAGLSIGPSEERLNPWPEAVSTTNMWRSANYIFDETPLNIMLCRKYTEFVYKHSKDYEATWLNGTKAKVNFNFDFHVDVIKNSAYTTLLILSKKVYEVKRQGVGDCKGTKVTRKGLRGSPPHEDTFCMYNLDLVPVYVEKAEDEGYMYYAPKRYSDAGVIFDPRFDNAMRGQGEQIRRYTTTYARRGLRPFQIATSSAKVADPQMYVKSSVGQLQQHTAILSNEAARAIQKAMRPHRGEERVDRSLYYTVSSAQQARRRRKIVFKTAEAVLLSLIKNKEEADSRHESLKVEVDQTCTRTEDYLNYLQYKLGVTKKVLNEQLVLGLSMLNNDDVHNLIGGKHAALVVTEDGAFAVLPQLPSGRRKSSHDTNFVPFSDTTSRDAIKFNINGTEHTLRLVHVPVVVPSAKGTHIQYRSERGKQVIFELQNAVVKDIWALYDGDKVLCALMRPEQVQESDQYANKSKKPGEYHVPDEQVLYVFTPKDDNAAL